VLRNRKVNKVAKNFENRVTMYIRIKVSECQPKEQILPDITCLQQAKNVPVRKPRP
jgi:hypothetical protein